MTAGAVGASCLGPRRGLDITRRERPRLAILDYHSREFLEREAEWTRAERNR